MGRINSRSPCLFKLNLARRKTKLPQALQILSLYVSSVIDGAHHTSAGLLSKRGRKQHLELFMLSIFLLCPLKNKNPADSLFLTDLYMIRDIKEMELI